MSCLKKREKKEQTINNDNLKLTVTALAYYADVLRAHYAFLPSHTLIPRHAFLPRHVFLHHLSLELECVTALCLDVCVGSCNHYL